MPAYLDLLFKVVPVNIRQRVLDLDAVSNPVLSHNEIEVMLRCRPTGLFVLPTVSAYNLESVPRESLENQNFPLMAQTF